LAIVIRSLKYHFESREEDNFFKPVAKPAGDDSGNNERAGIAGVQASCW